MPEEELKNLLEQFQASGRADSSGVFTMAAHKAQEKLSQFQLARREDYIKNLVAAAVLGGATSMEVRLFATGSATWFDGESYQREHLETLLLQLLNPTNRALVELAVAVNSLRRGHNTVLTLTSVESDGRGLRLRVRGDNYAIESVESGRPGNLFEFNHEFEVGRFFFGWRGGYAEQTLLRKSCCHAPLNLTANEKAVQEPITVGRSQECLAWLQVGTIAGLRPPAEPSSEWATACLKLKEDSVAEEFGCVLALSPEPEAQREGLNLLNSGVHFQRGRHLLVTPLAHGILWGPLDKNVSHSDLAENEKFRRLVDWGRSMADWLTLRRLESPLPIPQSYLPLLIAQAPNLADRFRRRGEVDSADAVSSWVAETQFLLHLKDEPRWKALLGALAEIRDPELLAARRLRLSNALLQNLEMSLQSSNYSECQPLCQKLGVLDPEKNGELSRNLSAALAAVCGREAPAYQGLEPTLEANLLRLEGRQSEALALLTTPLDRGQVFLALEQAGQARDLLREAGTETAESMEALSDCLALSPGRTGLQRRSDGPSPTRFVFRHH